MSPFIEASRFCDKDFNDFALAYDLSNQNEMAKMLFSNRNMLSHFFFYQIDGILELHKIFQEKGLRDLEYDLVMMEERFLPNRTPFLVPAFKDLPWVCSPGQAQAAICFNKLGMERRFKMAMDGMRLLQNPSGGFWGSYGVPDLKKDPSGVWYFPTSEISWAVKFFMDACMIEEGIVP
jgi:malonyl-CoA O-methyltransferase